MHGCYRRGFLLYRLIYCNYSIKYIGGDQYERKKISETAPSGAREIPREGSCRVSEISAEEDRRGPFEYFGLGPCGAERENKGGMPAAL